MKTITKIKYIPEEGDEIVYTVLDYPIDFWGVRCYKVLESDELISMRPGDARIEILEEI